MPYQITEGGAFRIGVECTRRNDERVSILPLDEQAPSVVLLHNRDIDPRNLAVLASNCRVYTVLAGGEGAKLRLEAQLWIKRQQRYRHQSDNHAENHRVRGSVATPGESQENQ